MLCSAQLLGLSWKETVLQVGQQLVHRCGFVSSLSHHSVKWHCTDLQVILQILTCGGKEEKGETSCAVESKNTIRPHKRNTCSKSIILLMGQRSPKSTSTLHWNLEKLIVKQFTPVTTGVMRKSGKRRPNAKKKVWLNILMLFLSDLWKQFHLV